MRHGRAPRRGCVYRNDDNYFIFRWFRLCAHRAVCGSRKFSHLFQCPCPTTNTMADESKAQERAEVSDGSSCADRL